MKKFKINKETADSFPAALAWHTKSKPVNSHHKIDTSKIYPPTNE